MSSEELFEVSRHTLSTKKAFGEVIAELENRSPVVPPSKFDELVAFVGLRDQVREERLPARSKRSSSR